MKNGYAMVKWCMALAAAFWLAPPAIAGQSTSANYSAPPGLFANGGGQSSSANYKQTGVVGYSFAQVPSTSTNYKGGLAIGTLLPAALGLNPSSLTFANQNVGSTSTAQTVTLTNSGAALATIASISASGDFGQSNNCTSLAAGASCTISVTFTPTAAGARTGTVTITSDAAGSPHTVSLSGTGVAVSGVSPNPASLTFAAGNIGSTSTAQTITLTNSGGATLNISSIAASGDYARTTTCGATLAAGASCTISVTFTPTAVGARSGSLSIASDAAGSPHTVSLSGTGIAPAITLNFATGWNLVGNSINTPLNVATTLGDTTKVTTVWKWIPATSKWAFYAPSMTTPDLATYATSKGYDVLTAINGGEGFWVNAKMPFAAQLPAGTVVSTSNFADQTPPPNKLPIGWSLIAVGDNPSPRNFANTIATTINQPISPAVAAASITTLWAWDNGLSSWYFYAPSLDNSNGLAGYITTKGYLDFSTPVVKTLDPATGFWVNHP